MSAKLPYYPMYPADFDDSETVRMMTLSETGLYLLCLNHAWKEGSIPSDPNDLAAALRHDTRTVLNCWRRVSKCFVVSHIDHSRMVNPRQEIERQKSVEKHNKRAAAGALGGRPSEKQCFSNASTRAYDSGSVSDSSLKRGSAEGERKSAKDPLLESQIAGLQEIYAAGGKPFSDRDSIQGVQAFMSRSPDLRAKNCEYAAWAFANAWRDPAHTKSFANLMADGEGDHGPPVRKLPQIQNGKTKLERIMEQI